MIVEFIGAPGAGKTTLAWDVFRRLDTPTNSVSLHHGSGKYRPEGGHLTTWESGVDRVVSSLRSPQLACWCAINVRSKRQFSELLNLTRRVRFADRLRSLPGLHLVDEGPFRQACTLSSRTDFLFNESMFRLIPLPDLAVLVPIDPQVALKRLRTRGERSELADWSDREIIDFVERNQEFALSMIKELSIPAVTEPSLDSLVDHLRPHAVGVSGAASHKSD